VRRDSSKVAAASSKVAAACMHGRLGGFNCPVLPHYDIIHAFLKFYFKGSVLKYIEDFQKKA